MMCFASCACGGTLPGPFCPMLPGCKACEGTNILVVRFTPIHLHDGESVDDRVQRDDMISQMPERYQQPTRMN